MGAGHGHRLHFHGHSWLHRARPELMLLGLVGFMLIVVATPPNAYAFFAGYLAVLMLVIVSSGVPLRYLLPRMAVELPFLVFAVLLPFVATGPTVEVAGLELSQAGLEAAAALVMKGSLGVLAALSFGATTEPTDLLLGLERLRMPRLLVEIMGFMIRYLDVVTAELSRMHIALSSRGFSARSPKHWPVIARSAGALFIRSYERGERVHLAMMSRGYQPGTQRSGPR